MTAGSRVEAVWRGVGFLTSIAEGGKTAISCFAVAEDAVAGLHGA